MPRTLLKGFYSAEKGEEKPSEFLSHHYLQLQQLWKVGAVAKKDTPNELVQQFLAGCHDETLLLKLKIDEKDPPAYGTLVASIQLEEAKRTCCSFTKKMAKSHQSVQAGEQIQ